MSDSFPDVKHQLAVLLQSETVSIEEFDKIIESFLGGGLVVYPKESVALTKDMANLARRIDYERGYAYSIGLQGYAEYMLSNHEAALPLLTEAYALMLDVGELFGKGMILGGLAAVQTSLGNYEQALEASFKALKVFRQTGDREQEGWCLTGMGLGFLEIGDYDRSLQYYEKSLKIFEEVGEKNGLARAFTGIGSIHQGKGEYEKAKPYHSRSLALFKEAESKIGEARALSDLGLVHQHLGDYEKAERLHSQSLSIREEVGNRQSQSTTLINLGKLYITQQLPEKALTVLHQSLDIAEDIKARPRIHQTHEALSKAYELQGNLERALHHSRLFHEVKEAVLGEQTSSRLKNLQISFAVESSKQEAEIERLRNVELREKNEQLERLLNELQITKAELQSSLDRLTETQDQLIHAEKMASLGKLTAGIAHEIKNPLNFVNNFAALSVELADELHEEIEIHREKPVGEVADDLEDILADLKFNAQKINEHGKRADSIVRGMLEHSRSQPGKRQPTDLNELLEEYLNLAYHGMRANSPLFNVTLEKDFDENLTEIEVVPQEIGRVFLNVLNNAFHAVDLHRTTQGSTYAPTVYVQTRQQEGHLEFRLSDNGGGIPETMQQRIFEPFFTTKATGEGTGLGLSLCYDIVTQGHGGTLTVESTEGEGATFIITLPAS